MKAQFDVDKLISLEKGVNREALETLFQSIGDGSSAEIRHEIARFARCAAWRVLPEILADDSPDFAEPIKRYMFARSCRALFVATHPDAGGTYDAVFANEDVGASYAASANTAANTANLAYAITVDAVASFKAAPHTASFKATLAASAAESATAERRKPLREPLLLAMREDLLALHKFWTLAGRELWSKEAASLFDVDGWFEAFRKNLERFEMGPEIPNIYKALLSGRIEQVIREYPPDLFEELFKSAESDYQEWKRGHKADDKDSPKEPTDEEPTAEAIQKSPRDTLHSEVPLATDHLNRDRLAEVLSTWLKKNQSHKAIGLFGDWGVGKSTFVNLLRKRLGIPLDVEAANDEKPSRDHYKTADYIGGEFNAWQYEHTDNIQAGLAQELIAALQANLKWRGKVLLTWRYHSVDVFIAVCLLLVIVVTCNFFFYAKDTQWFSWLESTLSLMGIGSLIGIGGIAIFRYGASAVTHPLAKKLRRHIRLPNFVDELGTIPVMREQVKAMVDLRLNFFKHKQRLLFVVDDLDRCSPDAVVKVLEAVRLIMDLPNVVVLIAIDQKIALASLALRYKELAIHYGADPKSIARQYLGKVIHVPITLDDPAPEAVENYLSKLWSADDVSETAVEDRLDEGKSVALSDDPPDKTDEDQTGPASTIADDLPVSHETLETPVTPKAQKTPKRSAVPAESTDGEDTRKQPGRAIIGLSQRQKDVFMYWARRLELANPRHIKRLDNAYNLIRMRYPDEDQAREPYYRLVMLMWIEYSHELPLDTYAAFRKYIRSAMAGEPDDKVEPLRNKLDKYNTQVSLRWDEVKAVWEKNLGEKSPKTIREAISNAYLQVRTFVLPAIEKEDFRSDVVEENPARCNNYHVNV